MLIEFSVANFRSIKERQTFSLMKGKGDELSDTNTFQTTSVDNIQLLKSAVIYGANASGKSNLLLALYQMRKIISISANNLQRGDKLGVVPFLLSEDTDQSPSEFEVIFIADKVRYQYGFTSTNERIHEEWLIAFPKGRAQRWFDREWNDSTESYKWEIGSNFSGEKQLWQKSTRENSLYLSTAVQLNSELLQPVFDWFQENLHIGRIGGFANTFTASLCEGEHKKKVLEFMRAADLHIDNISVDYEKFNPESLPKDMPNVVKDEIIKSMKNKEITTIKTIHKTKEGKTVKFDIEDESHGTQRFFDFAGPWIDVLENGHVLFVDELNHNLHPKLVKFMVNLFHDKTTNPKNAQLVFTTHETSILDQNIFRRDQVWFCEKDQDQCTSVYPLSNFNVRKGRENLELSYLSGRYGAIPNVTPLEIAF